VNAAIFIGERLMSAAKVNDREAAKTEADRARDEVALIVWTTMADGVRHTLDESGRNTRLTIEN
jgi:hypothetical protein